jgi:hypothetical protein
MVFKLRSTICVNSRVLSFTVDGADIEEVIARGVSSVALGTLGLAKTPVGCATRNAEAAVSNPWFEGTGRFGSETVVGHELGGGPPRLRMRWRTCGAGAKVWPAAGTRANK